MFSREGICLDFLFLVFLFSHLITDYLLQTNKIAAMKGSSEYGVRVHVTIILIVGIIVHFVFFGLEGVYSAVFIAVIHYMIDMMKFKIAHIFGRAQLSYFFLDQFMHLASIFVTAVLFTGMTMPLYRNTMVYVVLVVICGWISVSPEGTIIGSQVLFDFHILSFAKGDQFFDGKSRWYEGTMLTGIFAGGILAYLVSPLMLIISAISYLILRKYLKDKATIRTQFVYKLNVYTIWTLLVTSITITAMHHFISISTYATT